MSMDDEIATLRRELAETCSLLIATTNTLVGHVAATQALYDTLISEGIISRDQATVRAVAYAQNAGLSPEVMHEMKRVLAPFDESSPLLGRPH